MISFVIHCISFTKKYYNQDNYIVHDLDFLFFFRKFEKVSKLSIVFPKFLRKLANKKINILLLNIGSIFHFPLKYVVVSTI